MDKSLKGLAHKQQADHLKRAHTQALKLLIQSQLPSKLTANEALNYLELVKSKLGPQQFEEFMLIMKQCKEPNCEAVVTISKIFHLLKNYPELLHGFGIFLPPSLNLQLQTQGRFLLQEISSESNLPPDVKNEDEKQVEPWSEVRMDVEKNEDISTNTHSNSEISELSDDEKEPNVSKDDDAPAISFLSRVKERFKNEPGVYESLIMVLHSVGKSDMENQQDIETEVYLKVCELFEDNEDLIQEFKMFVPNADYSSLQDAISEASESQLLDESMLDYSDIDTEVPSYSAVNDPSAAPVYKYGSYEEHLFFDQVRAALCYPEVYNNFLRCLMLFNEDVVTRSELLKLATSFLGKTPDLLKNFKDLLGFSESGNNIETIPMRIISYELNRINPEKALDIDYATGGRNGASYRALPQDQEQPKCSGRTPLCKEVLNDIWVSFPSWSEDSTFVTSRKTEYEEMIYRCEDERFELDMAIQSNAHTVTVLDSVQKRINKMTSEEKSMLALDDTLGGTSTVLHQKALHRLYGDKTEELVEGLKRNPVVAVPIILKRLRAKNDEWIEKQRIFNNHWRNLMDNYYIKSLDHQGINFKQNDSKSFRSKNLLNEMEMVYAEKKEGLPYFASLPHFILELNEQTVFLDALSLICQYLKKIPAMFRDDRRRIEHLLRNFVPDFYGYPRAFVAEEEIEEEEEQPEENMDIANEAEERSGHTSPSESGVFSRDDAFSDQDESNSVEENEHSEDSEKGSFIEDSDIFDKLDNLPVTNLPYTLFLVNKSWYIFFRQFHILCERLSRLLHEGNKKDRVIIRKSSNGDGEAEEEIAESKPTYVELILKLSQLLSGSIDYATFEEDARSLFGIHAFVSFTMDKLVLNIVRQLQQIVNDDLCKQLTGRFVQHTKMVSSGSYASPVEASQIEADYLKKVERLMEEEKCFKIMWHKKESTLTIELIEHENEEYVEDPCEVEKFSNYLDAFVTGDGVCEEYISFFMGLPVFLPRNLKKQQEYWKRKVLYVEKLWKTRYSSTFLKHNPPIFSRKRKSLLSRRIEHSKVSCPDPSFKNDACSIEQNKDLSNENKHAVDVADTNEDTQVDANESGDEIQMDSHEACDETQVDTNEPGYEIQVDTNEPGDETQIDANEPSDETPVDANEPGDDICLMDDESCVVISDEKTDADGEKESVFLIALEEDDNGIQENEFQVLKIECEEEVIPDATAENDADSLPLCEDSNTNNLGNNTEASKDEQVESMDVDDNSCSSVVSIEKKVQESNCSEEENTNIDVNDNDVVLIDINPEDLDTNDQVESVIQEPADVVITVEDSADEITVANDSDSVGKEVKLAKEESVPDVPEIKPEPRPTRLKARRKIPDGTRSRRTKAHQDYVRRRVKKATSKASQMISHKDKKGKKTVKIPEEYDDISFDYAAFSELSEEDKCLHLALKSVFVHDDTECTLKKETYKMIFVQNRDTYVFRKNCLARAKEIQQQVSEIKTSNFNAWHRVWLERYVTPAMLKSCNDWFLRSDSEKYKVVRITVSNGKKLPHIPCYKYRLRFYKTAT